ncbi:hypothetical protein RNQ50_05950, partial [Escherichia coli]|nr:hypothetical protein [Escherichia coli]
PSISDGRLSYQFSSDGYIRRSVYAYRDKAINHDFRQLEKYLEPIPKADWEQVKAYYYAM